MSLSIKGSMSGVFLPATADFAALLKLLPDSDAGAVDELIDRLSILRNRVLAPLPAAVKRNWQRPRLANPVPPSRRALNPSNDSSDTRWFALAGC